jgi:hypothetical protein
MPIVMKDKETGEIVGGYGYKSGENGKVGNPDTSPAPTQASGITMLEQRPIKDSLKPSKPIKAMY